MRILFMGTPAYATEILKPLLKYEVVGLFTQPDKPVGRKQILTPPHIKAFAEKNAPNIPIFQPKSLKDKRVIEQIEDLKPDFIVVAAYGKILPKEILALAPCINLHASLLPKYRGASPIQHALLNGDEISGVTAMLMDEGLDTGDILGFDVVRVERSDNAVTLFDKLSKSAAALTPLVLENFDSISSFPQNGVDASYCKKIEKRDGLVEFDDAKEVFNRYRAFYFWPGIFLKEGLKLKELDLIDTEERHRPGEILDIGETSVKIGCKRGALEIFRVQPPSKKEMDAASYVRGKRLKVGDSLV